MAANAILSPNPLSNTTAEVDVQPIWWSKQFWTQVLAVAAMLGAYFGWDFTPQTQAAILAMIVPIQGVLSVVFKLFSKTVTPTAAGVPANQVAT